MKTRLLRRVAALVAYLLAAMLGAMLGGMFFYVAFFFPTWFMRADLLLLWGWFGTPIGVVGGTALFLATTQRSGAHLARRFERLLS
jgi:hypothetical protein